VRAKQLLVAARFWQRAALRAASVFLHNAATHNCWRYLIQRRDTTFEKPTVNFPVGFSIFRTKLFDARTKHGC